MTDEDLLILSILAMSAFLVPLFTISGYGAYKKKVEREKKRVESASKIEGSDDAG